MAGAAEADLRAGETCGPELASVPGPNAFARLGSEVGSVVLDTNCVLDLWLFDEPAVAALKPALRAGEVRWFATAEMRRELARVLGYPAIVRQLARHTLEAADLLRAFDRWAHVAPPGARVPVRCSDTDDQIFIDLAAALHARLFTRDRAIRVLAPRLLRYGVRVAAGARSAELVLPGASSK